MVNEILVLAYDDRAFATGTLPNHRVIRGLQTDVEDVRGLVPLADNPARQRGWKLRINEEVHAGCKTAWSDWRAA